MSFGLGFWAAAGAGAPTDYELISTTVVSGTTTNLVTFSSIPQTYKHLQMRFTYQVNTSSSNEYGLTVNPNSGIGNSAFHWLAGNGSSVYSTSRTSTNTANYGLVPYPQPSSIGGTVNPSSSQSQFVAGIVDILDYASSTKNKTFKSFSGLANVASSNNVTLSSMLMNDTAAITQLSMYASNAPNYTVGSRFSLYGIKG
jgi:hypothetical protein